MPNPGKKEKQDEFIARYMGDEEAKKAFPDEKQRLAVAYSKWKAARKRMAANEAADVFNEVRHYPAGSSKGGQFMPSKGGDKGSSLSGYSIVSKGPTDKRLVKTTKDGVVEIRPEHTTAGTLFRVSVSPTGGRTSHLYDPFTTKEAAARKGEEMLIKLKPKKAK